MHLVFGDYTIEPEAQPLQHRGERVAIEPKVFGLLGYLIEQRQRVVPAEELFDLLWPGVNVTPGALHRAVGDDGECQAVVRTEHGHGFRFVAEAVDCRERVDELLRDPVREVLLIRVAAHVHKRRHRDGWPIGIAQNDDFV